MNLSRLAGITLVAVLFFIPACTTQTPMDTQLASSIKRFAPTVITADTSRLSAGNKAALKKLIAAAREMAKKGGPEAAADQAAKPAEV